MQVYVLGGLAVCIVMNQMEMVGNYSYQGSADPNVILGNLLHRSNLSFIDDVNNDVNNDINNDDIIQDNINSSQTFTQRPAPTTTQRQKPWLVVHVGPSKTATTTIQGGLDQHASELASTDNIFFLGSNMGGERYFRYREISNSNSSGGFSFSKIYKGNKFLGGRDEEFVSHMKWHAQQKHNLVISCELFTEWLSRKLTYFDINDLIFLQTGGYTERIQASKPDPSDEGRQKYMKEELSKDEKDRRRKQDFRRSRHTFNNDDSSSFAFDVKFVVTYRHYFQWLPSYFYQSEVANGRGIPSIIKYIELALEDLGEQYYGDETINLTNLTQASPPLLQKKHGPLYSYLKYTANRSFRDRVDIFDMHQQHIQSVPSDEANDANATKKMDVFRDFVCQALPDAASTCSELHTQNKKPIEKRVRTKVSGFVALETGRMTDTQDTQMKRKADSWFEELRGANSTHIYENLTWEDSIMYNVSVKISKRRMRKNFESWVKKRAKRLQESPESDDGHRLHCLGEESSKKLRNASWNILRHLEALVRLRDEIDSHYIFEAVDAARPKYPLLLSPNKYNHSNVSEDADWWGPLKRAHDDLFEKTVESGAFCELDLEHLFNDEDFVRQVFLKS